MTKESLVLFYELLKQVQISPMQKDAKESMDRVLNAKKEIEEELSSHG